MSDSHAKMLVDNPLDETVINTHLQNLPVNESHILQSVDSTNSFLMSRPAALDQLSYCLAESQHAGRGRHGNQWLSAANKNIMLSTLWGYQNWPDDIAAMSLAVGVVLMHTLREECGLEVTLKWPNDLLVADHKLGGILIEMKSGAGDVNGLVVGIGLNCHQPDWNYRFDYPWVDLRSLEIDIDRNHLVAKMISNLIWLHQNFSDTGFQPFRAQFNERFAFRDRLVVVTLDGQEVQGIARGLDERGALVVDTDQGVEFVSDSRASLRLAGDS